MLGAFARAYAVLAEEKYLHAAERNLAFLRGVLRVDGADVMEASGVWSIAPATRS
jgi:uncharacterized protein YyaL (SSP411 family)